MPHVADPVLAGDDGSRCAGSIAIAHGVRHLTDGAHPAGGNVIGATDPPWVGDGQHVGGRDVGDMNEVPALRPVLEDARWSAPREARCGLLRSPPKAEASVLTHQAA